MTYYNSDETSYSLLALSYLNILLLAVVLDLRNQNENNELENYDEF